MSNEDKNTNKDTANSLGKYSDYEYKGTNAILDVVNSINNWYANELDKISEVEIPNTRLETNVDNNVDELTEENEPSNKIETKVDEYNEIQTNEKEDTQIINDDSKIETQTEKEENEISEIDESENFIQDNEKTGENQISTTKKSNKIPKRISTVIKGTKLINNVANKFVKAGKTINTGLNEGGLKSFEKSSSKIMTKPVKKVATKVTGKATNIIAKESGKAVKKVARTTKKLLMKILKLVAKLVMKAVNQLSSMLPSIAPIIIIILIIACFCSFFGIGMSEDTKKYYEEYMINTQNEYDNITVEFYNQGHIVDGAINGKGMINWKAPLSILQMLNGDMTFDDTEKELLNAFKNAELFEKITDETYTYEKEIVETDSNGNTTTKKETVTETKKIVTNPSLTDYINWCNNNFDVINNYKKNKKLSYDSKQTKFTDSEVEQIKLLYNSNSFFELFSDNFKTTYAYAYVNIGDEQIQAIYNEFLKNAGKRYLMDHSNLAYDNCMDYYDCSSWVIHCLAHCKIATLPNTTASGIYNDYCYPVNVNDRKAGDLIFLKDTYDTGTPGGISHIGIYMGELTINGETTEWIIDTGGNPSGVKISQYQNGWWNGSNFYGFARLK